jgi:subtilisin family serine protease
LGCCWPAEQPTSDTNILNGIGWCDQQRNMIDPNMNLIVSMSLGGSSASNTAQAEYNRYAAKSNTMLIAAAGNAGPNTLSYPARLAGVVSVAAVDRFSNLASFSSTNDDVEIAGPGVSVESWHGPTSPPFATVALTGALTATISAPYAATMFTNQGTAQVGTTRLVACALSGACTGSTGSGNICVVDRGTFTFCDKVRTAPTP